MTPPNGASVSKTIEQTVDPKAAEAMRDLALIAKGRSREDCVRAGIASVRIEGGDVDAETKGLLNGWADGDLSDEELMKALLAPYERHAMPPLMTSTSEKENMMPDDVKDPDTRSLLQRYITAENMELAGRIGLAQRRARGEIMTYELDGWLVREYPGQRIERLAPVGNYRAEDFPVVA